MTAGIATLFFFSGAVALTYEILWIRDLGTVFGASSQALSAVVAAFLTGLALGAWWAGRRRWGKRRGLLVYAAIEVAIALTAPWVSWACRALDRMLLDPAWDSLAEASLTVPARFLAVFALLLVPTGLMGASLPVLCTTIERSSKRVGEIVGRLYGWNTLGGVLGCLIAGTVLLERVGLSASIFAAAIGNLLLAAGAVLLHRRAPVPESVEGIEPAERAAVSVPPPARRGHPALLAAVFVASLLAIAVELQWTRLIALAVGGTAYAFALVLATYLAGLGLGAVAVGACLRRRSLGLPTLAGAQVLIGGLILGSLGYYDDAVRVAGLAVHEAAGSWWDRTWISALLCVVVVLPPALVIGISFPLLTELYVSRKEDVGRGVGALYLFSTLGGIAGATLSTYAALPLLGLEWSLLVVGAATAVFAAVLLVVAQPFSLVRVGLAAILLVGAAFFGGGETWWSGVLRAERVPSWARSSWVDRDVYGGLFLYGEKGQADSRVLLEHTDGTACSVAVFQQHDDVSLAVNGKVDASASGDMGTQLLLAWLPQLLHPDPARTFVLGWGAGVTAGAAAEYGSETICAEIERAVIDASPHFADVNYAAHEHPRVRIAVDDGRAVLRRARQPFQIITTEPSNPWMSGMSSLFTTDFYRLCRERMTDDGILCQWVQLYWSSAEDYRSILATLNEVFPHLLVFQSTFGDTLMLASPAPLALDWTAVAERVENRDVVARGLEQHLRGVGAQTSSKIAHLASRTILAAPDLAAMLSEDVPRITDDRPFLEFTAARRMRVESGDEILRSMYGVRESSLYGEAQLERMLSASQHASALRYVGIECLRLGRAEVALRVLERARQLDPGFEEIDLQLWAARLRSGEPDAAAQWPTMLARFPGRVLLIAEELGAAGARGEGAALLRRLRGSEGASAIAAVAAVRLELARKDVEASRAALEEARAARVSDTELRDLEQRLDRLEAEVAR